MKFTRDSLLRDYEILISLCRDSLIRRVLTVFVMWWECIALQAKWAYPKPSPSIDLGERIQLCNGLADYAAEHETIMLTTALHGALHDTGSYGKSGWSDNSLRGVYKAPIGTTSLEASMRELGNVFHERRRPSLSST
jgi:hypothetical protein